MHVPMMPQIQPACVLPWPLGSIWLSRIFFRSRPPMTQAAMPKGRPTGPQPSSDGTEGAAARRALDPRAQQVLRHPQLAAARRTVDDDRHGKSTWDKRPYSAPRTASVEGRLHLRPDQDHHRPDAEGQAQDTAAGV